MPIPRAEQGRSHADGVPDRRGFVRLLGLEIVQQLPRRFRYQEGVHAWRVHLEITQKYGEVGTGEFGHR